MSATRWLAAVLAADVAGYSRLLGAVDAPPALPRDRPIMTAPLLRLRAADAGFLAFLIATPAGGRAAPTDRAGSEVPSRRKRRRPDRY